MTNTATIHTFATDDARARLVWNGNAYRALTILRDDEGGLSVELVRVTKRGADFKRGARFMWLTLECSLEKFPANGGLELAVYVRETVAALDVRVERASRHGGCSQAVCKCGWRGVLRSNRTVEGAGLADRDAREHAWSHVHGAGWFDYTYGWVANPHPCACHYTTGNSLRALVGAAAS